MRLLLVVAAVVAGADLLDKAAQPAGPDLYNPRSGGYAVLAFGLAAALAALAPRVGSRPLAAAAGVAVGGALANGLSALLWQGVPDPLVAGGFAFNVADAAVLLGVAGLAVTAGLVALSRW